MIEILLIYISIVLTYLAMTKKENKEPEIRTRTMYSKANYSTPLRTYREDYEQFRDKKSNLYVPIKQKGRGVEIKNDKG